jgi:glucosyl-dolichyl phosphate glucuronosyltransferase
MTASVFDSLPEVPAPPGGDAELAATVMVCAYTMARWDQTKAAIASVLGQEPRPAQVILVVDHNAELASTARAELDGVLVLDSTGPAGLSGARNTGLQAATQAVTVFLDDDAQARPGWLATLVRPYSEPAVVATGGHVEPLWARRRPAWLPPEFDWVVGCSYRGLPEAEGPVRNPIGANMSMRTRAALEAGGFDGSIGRVGGRPRGCEETELAIRMTTTRPGAVVMYVPAAAVDHHVGQDRLTVRYLLRRCWHEGQSKAAVVGLVGASSGLARERRQITHVIPAAIGRDLGSLIGGHGSGAARIAVSLSGLAATVAGYLAGRLRAARPAPAAR